MNRLLVAPSLFFKGALLVSSLVSGLALAEPMLSADDTQITEQKKRLLKQADQWSLPDSQVFALSEADKELSKKMKEVQDSSALISVPANNYEDAARDEAARLFSDLQTGVHKELQLTSPARNEPEYRTLIFASHSLGENALRELFSVAASYPDTAVVFRGVIDLENFAQGLMAIQRLAASQFPVANAIIDPTLFEKHNVTSVPTIVALAEDKTSSLASIKGIFDPAYLLRRVESGQRGDLGIRGPVEDITERDLIEVMQERVAKIDWEDKKKQASERFWERQTFYTLPKARRARTKTLDPSVVVVEDLQDAEGRTIIPAGTVINPLDVRGFSQAVVVFDPLDQSQVELVKAKIPSLQKETPRITLIATRFDGSKGWDSYKQVTDNFDAPVYKLTPDVLKRFELEFTPSVITAKDRHFVIEELAREIEG